MFETFLLFMGKSITYFMLPDETTVVSFVSSLFNDDLLVYIHSAYLDLSHYPPSV